MFELTTKEKPIEQRRGTELYVFVNCFGVKNSRTFSIPLLYAQPIDKKFIKYLAFTNKKLEKINLSVFKNKSDTTICLINSVSLFCKGVLMSAIFFFFVEEIGIIIWDALQT